MFNKYHGFHENEGFIDEKNAQLFSKILNYRPNDFMTKQNAVINFNTIDIGWFCGQKQIAPMNGIQKRNFITLKYTKSLQSIAYY